MHGTIPFRREAEGPRWHALYTGVKSEFRVREGVRALGIANDDVWYPVGRRRVHRKGGEDAWFPIFPRYVFVRFDSDRDPWNRIREVDGVEDVLRSAEWRPLTIPDKAIEDLQSAQNMGLFDERRVAAREVLQPGQDARILKGPFAEFVGKVVRMKNAKRVEILLGLFGRAQTVELSLAEVRPA
jgi:transcription antitermination factor NusG